MNLGMFETPFESTCVSDRPGNVQSPEKLWEAVDGLKNSTSTTVSRYSR